MPKLLLFWGGGSTCPDRLFFPKLISTMIFVSNSQIHPFFHISASCRAPIPRAEVILLPLCASVMATANLNASATKIISSSTSLEGFFRMVWKYGIFLQLLKMKSLGRTSIGMKMTFVETGVGSCATTSRSSLGQVMRALTACCAALKLRGKFSARLILQFLKLHQAKMMMIQKRKKRILMPQIKGNQATLILRIHLERNMMKIHRRTIIYHSPSTFQTFLPFN